MLKPLDAISGRGDSAGSRSDSAITCNRRLIKGVRGVRIMADFTLGVIGRKSRSAGINPA